MSDTPLKRSTRRTTSVRRTVETTTRRTSISVPTGNTSVNIATAFKLSGFSDSTVDPVESSRNSRTSIHNTPVPTKNQEDTATEEELSDKNSATDSQEDEQFETPHSTGLGRRLLASILPKSPMWIRAGTPQRNESQERDSQTNSESESDPETHQSKPLQTRRTRSLGLRRNIEPPNTVNLVAGRYYLRPRANSPSNSPARVPAQIQEHLASSSDDEEWSPKPALYESASQSKGAISRKLEGDFEDNSEEPSSDEYSYSETESEDDYPEVIKVPIWRPIQAAIVGCFAGIGQIIKSILSAIGFLIFMVFWILKEIAVTLYSYTSYIATTLFVAPVRAIASSERVQDLVSMGARGFTTLFRFITKYLGLVLIFAAISGVVWTNLSSRDHEHLLDNIRENLDYHKYIEKLPKINPPKLKLPEISLPDISLPEISLPEISLPDVSLSTFKSYLPSFDVRLTPWLEKQRKAFDEYAPSFKVPSKPQPPKITDGKVVAPQPERSDVDSESFAELQSRLESLEDSLRQLSFVANRLVDQNDDHREAVSSEVTHQANTDKEIESLKDLIGEYVKANENQKITVDSILQAIKENDHKLEGFSLNIGSLRKQVDLAESKMNALDADVANTYIGLEKVKEEVAKLSQLDYYSHQILDTVKHTLPKYLVASKNGETGSVEIAPEFYHYLNSLFVTPAKLESVVQENLVRSNQPDLPSWDEFLESNQKELHALIRTNIDKSVKSMKDTGAVVGKKDFVAILQAKLESLKDDVTSAIQKDIDSVTQKFEQKIRKNLDVDSHAIIENPDTVSLVNHLIEGALAKYSADTLGLPDFALYSGGGRVIPSLTSATYHVPSNSYVGRLVARVFNLDVLGSGNPPTIALTPDIHLGRCWPFPGAQGNLTVLLSRNIIPTEFSVEHVPRSVAIDVGSAPRKLAVYGLYEKTGDVEDEISGETVEHEGKLYIQHFLSSYEYDVNNPRNVQTFSVQAHTTTTRPVRIVQLRVLSNYGQETYTCLYRFRVHGKIPE